MSFNGRQTLQQSKAQAASWGPGLGRQVVKVVRGDFWGASRKRARKSESQHKSCVNGGRFMKVILKRVKSFVKWLLHILSLTSCVDSTTFFGFVFLTFSTLLMLFVLFVHAQLVSVPVQHPLCRHRMGSPRRGRCTWGHQIPMLILAYSTQHGFKWAQSATDDPIKSPNTQQMYFVDRWHIWWRRGSCSQRRWAITALNDERPTRGCHFSSPHNFCFPPVTLWSREDEWAATGCFKRLCLRVIINNACGEENFTLIMCGMAWLTVGSVPTQNGGGQSVCNGPVCKMGTVFKGSL